MDDVTKVESQLSQGGASQPGNGAPIRIVETQAGSDGQVRFNLPVSQDAVISVEVVDLDMLVVTKSGDRFLLPQAALQATVSPDKTTIKFSNGTLEPASEELKRVGVVKQVEGGSYRIQAAEIKPAQGIRDKDGSDFSLSKESSDNAAQQQIADLQAQLNKVLQSQQTASSANNQASEQSTHHFDRNALSDATNKLVSPPASPPQEAKKYDYQTPPSPSTSDLPADRQLFSTDVGKLDGVLPHSGASSFKLVETRSMLAGSPLEVDATGTTVGPNSSTVDPNNAGKHVATADLILPGLVNAASVKLTLADPNATLPPDFKINGTTVTSSSEIVAAVNGIESTRVHLSWSVADDSTSVTPSSFALGVRFSDASGNPLVDGSAPINFTYSDVRDSANTYTLDGNSHYVLMLSARGWSYAINGTSGNDVISGGDGHDVLRGGTGNDTLNGGWGDDTLIGGAGSDSLDGGTGNNTASYEGSATAVNVYLDTNKGSNSGGDAAGDVLTNIQNVVGSSNDDILVGNSAANMLNGGLGNDTLEGGAGADTLIGGGGSDTASYEHAVVNNGIGVTASLNPALQQTLTTPDDATGDAYQGIANLRGSSGNDLLIGDGNDNKLEGLGGNDTLEGGAGADILDGGSGNNTASYEHASVTELKSDGTKVGIVASLADTSVNTGDAAGDTYVTGTIQNLKGSNYNDSLVGDSNANVLDGGGGNDTLEGGAGADTLIGGDGVNTATYANASASVTARLDKPDDNTGDAQGDVYSNNSIQNITGSNYDDVLAGNGGANVLDGGTGNDTLIGGTGGGDTLIGGADTDTATYADAKTYAYAYLAAADQSQNAGSAAGDVYRTVENLIGSKFDDYLQGDDGNNSLSGGEGNDTLAGGVGSDTLDGGAGTDTVSYANAGDKVELNLGSGGISGDAAGDVYVSIENAIGSNYGDKITGSAANNVIDGGAGNDTLDGGGGTDTLKGGSGDDTLSDSGSGTHTYDGGDGIDTVTYENLSTAVHLDLSATQGNTNGAGSVEVFTSIENLIGGSNTDTLVGDDNANSLQGRGGDDVLKGGGGNDSLDGGDGNDTLDGGAGADQLSGGSGTDTATYAQSSSGQVIDLANTTLGQGRGTGDAKGDTFSSIEIVEGSAYSDYFYAGQPSSGSSSLLFSGAGNSGTITVGGTTYSGDTVDFSGSNAAVNVNLATNVDSSHTGSGGWASGTYFKDISNLVGSSGNDTLAGDSNANLLKGGTGNDILIGGGGEDTLDGGAGTNTASYAGSLAGVNASLTSSPSGTSDDATGDVYINIQNLTGSDYADTLEGGSDSSLNNLNNLLSGGSGDDLIYVSLGSDTLDGGDGSDTVSFANLSSSLSAGVTISLAVNSAQTFDSTSTVTLTNVENLTGTSYADSLTGDANNNILSGGDGNDTLVGGAGADKFVGGNGTDTVSYAYASSGLTIDLTNQTQSTSSGHGSGDAQGDVIGYDVEKVVGTSLDDTFFSGGRSGSIQIDGGNGVDTVSYLYASSGVSVYMNASDGTNGGSATGDSYLNIENLVGSSHADTLMGDSGNNSIDGGDNNDLIYASAGQDSLTGGAGTDTVDFSKISGAVQVDLSLTNSQTFDTNGDKVLLSSIENLIGGAGNDTLTGDGNANVLMGGAGTDSLVGGAGDDTLVGGAGTDTLIGGTGTDVADYSYVTSAITIDVGNAGNGTGDAQGDVIDSSIEKIYGSATAANTFYGRSTAEEDYGGNAGDTFYGSGGADTYHGGNGVDTVSYYNDTAAGAVSIDLSTSAQNNTGGNAAGDFFDSIEVIKGTTYADSMTAGSSGISFLGMDGNDTLTGGSGNCTLDGGSGNDSLVGGSGNDSLIAGNGNDSLYGGSGNDTLDLRSGNSSLNGDYADGGAGSDTIVVNQPNSSDSFTLKGGGGSDTLQFYASSSGILDMTSVFANNDSKYQSFSTLDMSKDGVASQLKVSYASIQALVDNGSSSDLTVLLDSQDTYSIDYTGASQSNTVFGNNTVTFKDSSSTPVTLATVHFQYA